MTRTDGATELLPMPDAGRRFSIETRVRLSDTTVDGHLRLDALARYVQDIATDDARATMPSEYLAWVVRRSVLEVHTAPVSEESCTLTTWCSGYGGRWAERRTSLVGHMGGRCDAVMIWVAIDVGTGAPVRLPDEFHQHYDQASGGRKVTARLQHADVSAAATVQPWSFRAADLDRLGHVNNTAYWVLAEEALASMPVRPPRMRGEVEYRDPVPPTAQLTLHQAAGESGTIHQWLVDPATNTTHATLALNTS